MIRAGNMRHFAEVQRLTTERTDSGANTPTWGVIARLPCEVKAITNSETVASDQVKRLTTYDVRFRWLRDIDSRCRLLIQNYLPNEAMTLRIVGMRDPDGKREQLIVSCVHIQPTAN